MDESGVFQLRLTLGELHTGLTLGEVRWSSTSRVLVLGVLCVLHVAAIGKAEKTQVDLPRQPQSKTFP